MKKLGIILSLLFLRMMIFAAPEITFGTTEHDFGNIREEGGKVKHVFEFTNTGDKPLEIIKVKSA